MVSLSGRDGEAALRRAAGTALCAAGLALLGLLIGAPLGMAVGVVFTWLAGTGAAHGGGDLLILVTFAPLGALLGAAVLPTAYLLRLLRQWWRRRTALTAGTAR